MKKINFYMGILLFLISLIMAFYYHYNHFYEFMLAGLFLILGYLTKDKLKKEIYYKVYPHYFVFGILGDLIFGINLAKLWHYNYDLIVEYIPYTF